MSNVYGIAETKEALNLALGIVKGTGAVLADKKVDLNDLAEVLKLLPLIQPAFDKIDQVPKEMGDLSAEESAELVAHVMTNLAVTDAKAKIYIGYGLKMVHKAYLIFVDVKAMQSEIAAAV